MDGYQTALKYEKKLFFERHFILLYLFIYKLHQRQCFSKETPEHPKKRKKKRKKRKSTNNYYSIVN